MSNQLKKAIKYYAETYCSMVVGTSLEEGYSAAEDVAHEFKYRYANTHGLYPDNVVADFVYSEANSIDM